MRTSMSRLASRGLSLALVLGLAGAAGAQTLSPIIDNRGGSTQADAVTGSFPDPVQNGYNVDPSEIYRTFNNLALPANDSSGSGNQARTVQVNMLINSSFLNVNSAGSRITGVRTQSSANLNIAVGSAAPTNQNSQAIAQDQQNIGFRVSNAPSGIRLRYVAFAASTGSAPAFSIEFRRTSSPANLISFSSIGPNTPSVNINRLVTLNNGDYELRGGYSVNLQRSAAGTTTANLGFINAVVCPADYDGSGTVTIDDIFLFLNAWFAGTTLSVDMNANNSTDLDDIFLFIRNWFTGCV